MTSFKNARAKSWLKIRKMQRTTMLTEVNRGPRVGAVRFQARLRGDEDGGALVEFALILPLLFVILLCIITFGITLNQYIQLTEATQVGARQLAIGRQILSDPCNTVATTISNAAPTLQPASLTFKVSITNSAGTATTYGPTSGTSFSCTAGSALMAQGQPATVTVSFPCNLTVYGVNYAPSCKLQAQVTELVQ